VQYKDMGNDSVDSDGTLNLKPNMGKKFARTAEVVMYEQLKGCIELDTGKRLVEMPTRGQSAQGERE